MKIHRQNLITALATAIEVQEKYEKEELHYTGDSGLLAGWKMSVRALRDGEFLEISGESF